MTRAAADRRGDHRQCDAAHRRQGPQHPGPGEPSLQSRRDLGDPRRRPPGFQPDHLVHHLEPLRRLRDLALYAAVQTGRGRRRDECLGNEGLLREKGLQVDILEDQNGIALYRKYRAEKPELDIEDWKGVAAVRNR
jgi:hypothetical protein